MDELKEWLPVLALVFGGGGIIAVLKYQAGQSKESFAELKGEVKDSRREMNARMDAQDDKLEDLGKVCERLDQRMETQESEVERLRDKYSFQGFTKGHNGQ